MNFGIFYMDLIATERHWSWTVIGIAYLVVAIVIRLLIFRNIVHETKKIDPNLYAGVKSLYLKNSMAGWVLFFLSFLLMIAIWVGWKGTFLERSPVTLLLFLLILLFFLSVILHLTAFAKALLTVLRQRLGVEREY